MGHVECNTKHKKGQHLRYEERLKLEALLKAKVEIEEIAAQLGCCKRTLRREIMRGWVRQEQRASKELKRDYYQRTTVVKTYYVYSADVAQERYDTAATAKGRSLKLGADYGFASEVARLVKEEKRSPYGALEIIRQGGGSHPGICLRTLYHYIDAGYIPGLTNKDLPNEGKAKKREYRHTRTATNNPLGRSITERDAEVEKREDFGHWEMDTVVGKQGTKEALLVLTERKTRYELIFKLREKTQAEVKSKLDKLEQRMGTDRFRRVFKTIAVDNGCEFLDMEGLEASVLGEKRTKVYYCHPYSAWERGSNENINRMIRRFIPKGADIGAYSEEQIAYIEWFINTTPRKVLEGYPSKTLYEQQSN
jgi:IS30 family transposase